MNRVLAIVATSAMVLAGATAVAVPASAITGNLCDPVEYRVLNGTTVDYVLTQECDLAGYNVGNPAYHVLPDIAYTPSVRSDLVWHQAVERAAGPCDEGWGESWQQWANEGLGGPVCVKDVVWGSSHVNGSLSVTIDAENKEVQLWSSTGLATEVYGCGFVQNPLSTNTLFETCPPEDR